MRFITFAFSVMMAAVTTNAARAGDLSAPQCEQFFANYERCVGLVPESQREDARTALSALRMMMKMAGVMNRGDANLTGALCENLKNETQKNSELQGYGCAW